MKLYMVEFDDGDAPRIEEGIAIETGDDTPGANLGVDVGGQTLAMVPLRIPLVGVETPADARLRDADVVSDEDGGLTFRPSKVSDAAFVVLSVIQRSPDARTEVDPYGEGVACVGNAFAKPMDRQLLILQPGASVRFRRFGRGAQFGRWFVAGWNGTGLSVVEDAASS